MHVVCLSVCVFEYLKKRSFFALTAFLRGTFAPQLGKGSKYRNIKVRYLGGLPDIMYENHPIIGYFDITILAGNGWGGGWGHRFFFPVIF